MASTTVPQPAATAAVPAAAPPIVASHDRRDPRYQAFAGALTLARLASVYDR